MSLAYFARVADNARGADAACDPLRVAISAMVSAYWALRNMGKLPPMSADDTDEAIDRVAATLPSLIATYRPERGPDLHGWVRLVLLHRMKTVFHAVVTETEQLVTGLFLDETEQDPEWAHVAPDSDVQSAEDAPLELVYSSPPLGFADPASELDLTRQLEAAEQLRRTRNIPVYSRRMRVSETVARRRLYALRNLPND